MEKESLSVPPTMGTQLSIANFKAFIPKLSAECVTKFWSARMLVKMYDINFKSVFKNLQMVLQRLSKLRFDEIEEMIDIPKSAFIKGTKKNLDMYDIACPAIMTKVWYDVADRACPEATIITLIIGTE